MTRKSGVLVLILTVIAICGVAAVCSANPLEDFKKAKECLGTRDYSKAEELFTKVLNRVESSPKSAGTVRLARAQAYVRMGDWSKAHDDLERLAKLPGLDKSVLASAKQLRGIVSIEQGRSEDGLQELSASVDMLSGQESPLLHALALENRGVAYIRSNQPDKAAEDFTEAIKLWPSGAAFAHAARALAFLTLDKADQARQDAEKALQSNPDFQTEPLARHVLEKLPKAASTARKISVPLDERGHMYVDVKFREKGKTYRFMLDTGASNTLINRAILDEIKSEAEVTELGKGTAILADGSAHAMTGYRVAQAFIVDPARPSDEAALFPLGGIVVTMLDKDEGKAGLLLGVGSLKSVLVTMDNPRRVAELHRDDVRTSP